MSPEEKQPSDGPPGSDKPRQAWPRVRPMEVALAVALVAAVVSAIIISQRGAPRLPPSALDRVSEVASEPRDENLATFNALAYHFYALKNDASQYGRVRANLANLATGGDLVSGIETAHASLLDLCRECERFFVERKDLGQALRLGQRESLVHTASSTGGWAVGTAAKFAFSGVSPLSLAVAGSMALGKAASHYYGSQKMDEAYRNAVDVARLGLNDQFARSEHKLVNLRAEMESALDWAPSDVLSEEGFMAYTDGLARFAEEDWESAHRAFKRIGALPGMAEALFYSGLTHLAREETQPAKQAFADSIRRQPKNFVYSRELVAAAHYHLAALELHDKRWNEAIGHANAGLELAGEESDFHCMRGEVLLAAEHLAKASEAFQTALELDPGSVRASYGLAQSMASQGKSEEALEWLEKAAAQGRINLTDAAGDPRLRRLTRLQRFNALTTLNIGHAIDWGPISDKVKLTNLNAFTLSNVVVLARRKNSTDDAELFDKVEVDVLEPDESFVIKGMISAGPKSRTEYFAYDLECDQGRWEGKDIIRQDEK